MSDSDLLDRLRGSGTEIVGLLSLGLVIAGFFGQPGLLLAGFVGMFVVTPLVALLVGDRAAIEEWWGKEKAEQLDAEDEQDADPLDTLKRRYAAGELSEAAFERKVSQLLKVDSLALTDESDDAIRDGTNGNTAATDADGSGDPIGDRIDTDLETESSER